MVHKLSTTHTRTPSKACKIARTLARSSQGSFDSRVAVTARYDAAQLHVTQPRTHDSPFNRCPDSGFCTTSTSSVGQTAEVGPQLRSQLPPVRARMHPCSGVFADSALAGVNSPSRGDGVTVGGASSPGSFLPFSRPFWDICKLSVEKGFPELICFPPRSLRIIMYLQMIHQSVHWSHMSSRRGKKPQMETSGGEDRPRKMLLLSGPVATIAMSHGGLVMTSAPMMS